MPQTPLTPTTIIALLAQGPARIGAATDGLAPAHLRTAPAAGEWSVNDVLAHLRACADVWGAAIETILAQDEPTIRAINPRTWIKRTDYLDLEFAPSFQAYAAQRAGLLALLDALPPEAWGRRATLTGAGATLQRTVLIYAESIAVHERAHLKQIRRIAEAMRL